MLGGSWWLPKLRTSVQSLPHEAGSLPIASKHLRRERGQASSAVNEALSQNLSHCFDVLLVRDVLATSAYFRLWNGVFFGTF